MTAPGGAGHRAARPHSATPPSATRSPVAIRGRASVTRNRNVRSPDRHPSRWPRMKVRGRRRRAAAARRHRNRDYWPNVVIGFDPASPYVVTFTPVHPSDPRPQSTLVMESVSDGLGRTVMHTPPPPPVVWPEPQSWSFGFTAGTVNQEALDALFGRKEATDA